jgi:bifunctional non-homologous end joining protein LigD
VWNARADDVERPDRLVFDLDPGTEVAWSSVVSSAALLRDELARRGLQSWPKLTGGNGLHVVVPFRPEHDWQHVYEFSRVVAQATQAIDAASLTLNFAKSGRARKILIDYKRNHRAAVAAAAYTARARPQGTVSVPLTWRELEATDTPALYTVRSLARRLQALRKDPWKDFWSCRQRLGHAR